MNSVDGWLSRTWFVYLSEKTALEQIPKNYFLKLKICKSTNSECV